MDKLIKDLVDRIADALTLGTNEAQQAALDAVSDSISKLTYMYPTASEAVAASILRDFKQQLHDALAERFPGTLVTLEISVGDDGDLRAAAST